MHSLCFASISLLFNGALEQAQTLLLKHGIDASHLYLCQIYQISLVFLD